MICKLCRQENDLCDSHIIPETFWKSINDKKLRSVPISSELTKLEFVQNGIKEKLLCQKCETKFSVWEHTLAKDLKDIGLRSSKFLKIKQEKENLLFVENINYENFKLAALSILWRLSVSTHNMFESYRLGPYEEKLRTLLLEGVCPPETKYPFMLFQYEISNNFYPGIILGFPPGRYENKFIVQKIIIWGHMFLFVVNDRMFPDMPIQCFIRGNGRINIVICDAAELISGTSVISRVYDDDVTKMMSKLST